ncbi:MAG TPA: hypothetical protein VGD66_12975 [Allosphingosinicella sp.]
MPYRAILLAFEQARLPYVVVGSMAAKLHGEPRQPRDLDVVIDPGAGSGVTHILMAHGFFPTMPLGLGEVPIMRFFDAEGREVDAFARFAIPFGELFARAEMADWDGALVRVASPADLVRARELTGR